MSIDAEAGEAYQKANTALNTITSSFTATPEQKKAAQAARAKLDAAWTQAVRDNFTSRTAQFEEMISALEGVRDAIPGTVLEEANAAINNAISRLRELT
jgi:hypothetical protein